MLRTDFSFDLPEELIAQHPSATRGDDRLMLLDRASGQTYNYTMNDLPSLVAPSTLMVFNDSRVRRARVMAVKETTGREHEFLFVRRLLGDGTQWRVLTGNARKQKGGMRYAFSGGITGTILDNPALVGTEERDIEFSAPITEEYFEQYGHMPLPPYIKRADDATDADRYQTVYAKPSECATQQCASMACPTAGLHFTQSMLGRLQAAGIEAAYVTLHVGLGTFLPVREDNIEDHHMHTETYSITDETAAAINRARSNRRPILAVGTTSVRTLESAADEDGLVQSGSRDTGIFIYPGYKFRTVDQMFTNFHTPQSTLLMLVSAFAGREHILAAYNEAVNKRYRFFSYGDAMLIK